MSEITQEPMNFEAVAFHAEVITLSQFLLDLFHKQNMC